MGKINDLTGQVFGRLKVIRYVEDGKWLCQCRREGESEPHAFVNVRPNHLRSKTTLSCGCFRREHMSKREVSKEALNYWYWDKMKTITAMAKMFGVGTTTICRWMDGYGIERRNPSYAMKVAIKQGAHRAPVKQHETGVEPACLKVYRETHPREVTKRIRAAQKAAVAEKRGSGLVDFHCVFCGNTVTIPGYRARGRKFCSINCKAKSQRRQGATADFTAVLAEQLAKSPNLTG